MAAGSEGPLTGRCRVAPWLQPGADEGEGGRGGAAAHLSLHTPLVSAGQGIIAEFASSEMRTGRNVAQDSFSVFLLSSLRVPPCPSFLRLRSAKLPPIAYRI